MLIGFNTMEAVGGGAAESVSLSELGRLLPELSTAPLEISVRFLDMPTF